MLTGSASRANRLSVGFTRNVMKQMKQFEAASRDSSATSTGRFRTHQSANRSKCIAERTFRANHGKYALTDTFLVVQARDSEVRGVTSSVSRISLGLQYNCCVFPDGCIVTWNTKRCKRTKNDNSTASVVCGGWSTLFHVSNFIRTIHTIHGETSKRSHQQGLLCYRIRKAPWQSSTRTTPRCWICQSNKILSKDSGRPRT
jgi:hypothetical protein